MKLEYLQGKTVLITGAAGTVGSALSEKLVSVAKRVRCFDHSESELFYLDQRLASRGGISPQLGDIRDLDRLRFAMNGVDVVFHCAALKHVGLGEYNPFEVVQSNLVGLNNVIRAALDVNAERLIFTSSDKAVNPTNVMGASKMMGERLVSAANEIRGNRRTLFSSVRFGNVIGSSGSVLPIFARQLQRGEPLTLTDEGMSRYVMTIDEAAALVLEAGERMRGGETFVTKMRAIRISDLAWCAAQELSHGRYETRVIGPRPGEKLYEELLCADELDRTIELDRLLVVLPPVGTDYPGAANAASYGNPPKVKKEWHSGKDAVLTRDELTRYLAEKELLAPFKPPKAPRA
jgi:FlaA1/EpsC-like NDP-sugar epimerase